MTNKPRKTLLRHWTARYLATLCIGLIVIGVISTMWIRYNDTRAHLNMMSFMSEEISERVVDQNGNLTVGPFLNRILEGRQRFLPGKEMPTLFITDETKRVLYSPPGPFRDEWVSRIPFPEDSEKSVTKIKSLRGDTFYVVFKKIVYNDKHLGWTILLAPEREWVKNSAELNLLVIMLGSLAILGWVVIYYLTRKLANPIKKVAEAAQHIVTGNYDIELDDNIREKEIYELINTFKEMAERLRQLEQMRTELLAGVTHELKTPVTSISGLVQAVRDEVVTGDEAKEFLKICTKETGRLQKMVEDLLDFNTFAVGEIRVHKERQNMNQLLQEVTHQWLIMQEEEALTLETKLPEKTVLADTDSLRVQQILYNLLNNAKQALAKDGQLKVSMRTEADQIVIEVEDNGGGIPIEEQQLIFERFYRGENKKHKVRGLGLGLPFSRLMARALGGELVLKESSPSGTSFSLRLPL